MNEEEAWRYADELRERVRPPQFPDRWFDLTEFGGSGSPWTGAFHAAIEACHKAGGGHVRVPPGTYPTGAIHLLSNVDLHVEAGATILFSTDPADYLPAVYTRFSAIECYNYSPFIYAYGQENIAITGAGTLDGGAGPEHWWPWVGTPEFGWRPGTPHEAADWAALQLMAARNVPVEERVFGAGHYLRPNLIQPYLCRNVLVEGVRVVRSPMWEIHPVRCENVLVRNVTIHSRGPNNDGCDPESCRSVVISGCVFDVGDDCIAIKAGRGPDGRRVGVPCEDVLIEDCDMRYRYGSVAIGTDTTGGIRNVFVRRCRWGGPGLYFGLYIKTNSVRGGFVENVFVKDIEISELTKEAVSIDLYHGDGHNGDEAPLIRNINVAGVRSDRTRSAYLLRGYPEQPLRDITIRDSSFTGVLRADVAQDVEGLSISGVTVAAASHE
ncbi:glycoside hydrolase family 28 protein [Nonomuraea sp. NPDC050451]|uniref:glycoside hydrolase family 28 protein n=1 Tax=Nonomuraea sp. NPDC050451 TaxID=3364364 RepID=UPI0037A28B13